MQDVVIGQVHARRALGIGVGVLVVAGALLALLVAHVGVRGLLPGYVVVYAVLLAAMFVVAVAATQGTTVVLRDDGIQVRARRRERVVPWEGLLSVSWSQQSQGPSARFVRVLLVRPQGGPWDSPGPNVPLTVAALPVFGRAANERIEAQLRAAAAAHGVGYWEPGRGPTAPPERADPDDLSATFSTRRGRARQPARDGAAAGDPAARRPSSPPGG